MKLIKNLITIAKNVLLNEADAIQKLSAGINDYFVDCLNVMLNSRGRIVVTGIGKSAIIGSKIVATFNSTGTPSPFIHAVSGE